MSFNPYPNTDNQPPKKLKALSMYQPYAWMVANGYTTIDDRSWYTPYRGKLIIHASKKIDIHYHTYLKEILKINIPEPEELDYGGIIAICDLTECRNLSKTPTITPELHAHAGQLTYGFVMENIKKIPLIPYRGMAGLFEIPISTIKQFL